MPQELWRGMCTAASLMALRPALTHSSKTQYGLPSFKTYFFAVVHFLLSWWTISEQAWSNWTKYNLWWFVQFVAISIFALLRPNCRMYLLGGPLPDNTTTPLGSIRPKMPLYSLQYTGCGSGSLRLSARSSVELSLLLLGLLTGSPVNQQTCLGGQGFHSLPIVIVIVCWLLLLLLLLLGLLTGSPPLWTHQSTSRPVWAGGKAFTILLLLLSAGYCYYYWCCNCWVSSLGHPLWTHQSTSRPVWAVGKAFTLFLSEEQLNILAAESNTFRVMQQISDESDDSWQCGIPVSVGMTLFLVLTR